MSAFRKTGMTIMSKTNYTSNKGGGFHPNNNKKEINRRQSANSTVSDFSRDTFKEQFQGRNRKDFINEANKIMRERMKNKGSTINSKSKFKSIVLMDSKEICLKNYLIGLLKDKRTDINEKERNIEKALKESETQLDRDCKEFIDFVEETKRKIKLEDDEFLKFRNFHEKAENIYRRECSEYKKLSEDLERTVKLICLLRSYGIFVYKVLGQKFWFEDIKEVNPRLRNYEEVANNILEKYDSLSECGKQQIINDESLLIVKFREFEDKVIKTLKSKETVDKEINGIKKNYDEEIEELQKRVKDFRYEVKRINREKRDLYLNNEKPVRQKDGEFDIYLKYIYELGQAIGATDKKNVRNKKNISDFILIIQDTLKILGDKEKEINGYINEIERIEEFGDRKLIHSIEMERKKENKREKQLMLKLNQEQIEKNKKLKAIERAKRLIIKGRKVPKELPVLKEKKKKNKDDNKNKNNDYDMLYYSEEEN